MQLNNDPSTGVHQNSVQVSWYQERFNEWCSPADVTALTGL